MRTKALENAKVKAEFEQLADEFSLLDAFLKARATQGLAQSAVARMEPGSEKHSPSLATLSNYADALGCTLEVRLIRKSLPTKNLKTCFSAPASCADAGL